MLPAQPNHSLIHGLSCLQLVATESRALGTREIARRLGLEPSRVSRLLGTLAHLGLVTRTSERKFQPGSAIHVLAAQSLRGSRLLRSALPFLRNLADEKLIIALGVLWRDQVCYLVHSKPGRPVESGIGDHGLYPAAQSGIGRVLLAFQPDEESSQTRRMLPLAQIRRQGHAVVRIESHYSMGVKIGQPVIGGIGLSGVVDGRSILRRVRRLKAVARQIEEAFDKKGG